MPHPERLGKYPITGVLGEGAMGVVYRGFDPDIRRVVALKTIRRLPGESAEAVAYTGARFRNEAQAAGRLQHPGIVAVYDFGDDGHIAYIAMEYVEGHTLADYLAHPRCFGEFDVASIMAQLLEALSHAHDNGVWHRDIKPGNVIMTRSGHIKIADFGIARTENSDLTVANAVLGTPMYMAPEQFQGRGVDHRADLYAAGVLLYQLVAGRPPFEGATEALAYQVVHEPPVRPSAVPGAWLGPRFDAVVARALQKRPDDRPVSAAAFRDAVGAALGRPPAAAVSREAVLALPTAHSDAPTERMQALPSAAQPATGAPPTTWDPAVLAQVEATLARYAGPLAALMVRRAARTCADMPALRAALAGQISSPVARDAFLARGSTTGADGSTGRLASPGTQVTAAAAAAAAPVAASGGTVSSLGPVSDALLEQAQRLLAAHVGPIARVVVKRSAERTRLREPLFALLAEAAPAPVRAKLMADLNRL